MIDHTDDEKRRQMVIKRAGLSCPRCGCYCHNKVLETNQRADRIHRRRQCRHCGQRFSTNEEIDPESHGS